jgi:hypothetical protein
MGYGGLAHFRPEDDRLNPLDGIDTEFLMVEGVTSGFVLCVIFFFGLSFPSSFLT